MRNVGMLIQQDQYKQDALKAAAWVKKAWKASLEHGELTQVESFKAYRTRQTDMGPMQVMEPFPWWDRNKSGSLDASKGAREEKAKNLIKAMFYAKVKGELQDSNQELAKAGVTPSLGYNFYDLRAPVLLLYPVNVPFRNSIPRVGRVNDGYGTAAHWKATRNVGTVYVGVSEGNRNASAAPDENDYTATYKQIGIERSVSFGAQFAGEGYADNLADEHLRGLHEIWLGEEGMDLLGNSGTGAGNNGFQLGTPPAPTVAAVVAAGNTIGTTKNISVCVIALTGMGNPANTQYGYGLFPTVASGLTPSYVRTNADGSQDTISGGFSASSPMSAVTSVDTSHVLNASIPGIPGAFGYAWYTNIIDASAPTKANTLLYAITQFPSVVVNAIAAGTQTAAATGLNVDNSAQSLDYDGLITYAAKSGYWRDLAGASLTSQKNGRVTEIETALSYFFTNFQAGVDAIWGSPDAIESLDAAVRYTGTNASGMQIFLRRDEQNNLLGGFVVAAYQSRFAVANPMGANAIPIRIHPMIPPGTIFFDISTNPYPHSRQPYVRAALVQRDYYSIEWPIVTRTWTFGTYSHQVLAHNMPWMCGVITGIGSFVGS